MTGCEVVYFRTERGDEPAKEFVDDLDPSAIRKYWRKIEYLRRFGESLCEPHAKSLGNGVRELRFRGADGHHRILYFFFTGRYAVLVGGFTKKTNKTPKGVIDLAVSRMRLFLASPERYGLGSREK